MAPAIKLPLPTGKIGVVFKGTPPVVIKVADDSPLKGKVKAGYIFEAMILSDGTVFEGLTAHELVATLNEYSEEEGRKLKMKMGLPDALEVSCPSGDLGITIAQIGDKPVVTKISNDSPLKKDMRVGLCVDKLTMEDGFVVTGQTAEEFTEYIIDDTNSSGRVLGLINPAKAGTPKSVTLPKSKSVDLPVGKLGVSFTTKKHTLVTGIQSDSPLRGALRVGMAVDSVTMTDGTEFRGLNAMDLKDALKNSSTAEGRKVLLKHPDSSTLPTISTTKVFLPDIGTAAEMGLAFAGSPAAFKEVAETSPIFGKARRGQVVLTVGWADGTEYDEVDADELEDLLQDSSGTEGRYLVMKNMPMPLPDEQIIALPAGKVGVIFKGTPPSVVRFAPDSPLADSGLLAGMVVDTLTLESGEVIYEMDAVEFVEALASDSESEKRVIRFINPVTMTLSRPPELEKPDELEITLPTGKLGVMFKGKAPCVVSSVNKKSPVRMDLPTGMAVDSLKVGKLTYIDLDAETLAGYLIATSDIEGRVMTLKNPEVEGVEFQKIPDSKEVLLPSGKLGVSLKGSPPMPVSYKEDSPVQGLFPTGMFVDMITLSDGTIMTGLKTSELVAVLSDSSEETERTLTFKNPKTKEPSAPGIILPDEMKIQLPVGKLGLSFKGKDIARASRIHEDSSVRNLVRIGMVVDSLDIPGGKKYSGLTAKEVCRILADTQDVPGRIMVLKNPMTTELTPRNIMASDDDSVITEADDGADDLSQVG